MHQKSLKNSPETKYQPTKQKSTEKKPRQANKFKTQTTNIKKTHAEQHEILKLIHYMKLGKIKTDQA